MLIQNTVKMLGEHGKSYITHDHCIKEDLPPYENCYQMKSEDGKWRYSLVIAERKNIPEYRRIKEFNTEEEAAKFLFLDHLSSIYFSNYVSPFIKSHQQLRINREELIEEKFYQILKEAHVPSRYICFDGAKTCTNCLMAEQENGHWILSYKGRFGVAVSSSRPLTGRDANFYLFKAVYLLWLFDTKAKILLEKHGVTASFTDKELSLFIF